MHTKCPIKMCQDGQLKQESADCQALGLGSNLPRYDIGAVRREMK